MSEPRDDEKTDDDVQGDATDEDRPLIPDADAGTTAADEYSRDEKDHGRQDHGP